MFGLTSSPFLLGRVIEHHLDSWESCTPKAVEELRKSLYADDLVSSGSIVEEAKDVKLSGPPLDQYKQFVDNRVRKIQAKLEIKWRHVPSEVACLAGGIRGHKGRSLKYRLPKN